MNVRVLKIAVKYGTHVFAEGIMAVGSDSWGRDTEFRCTTIITIIVTVINKHGGTRDNGYMCR